MSRTGRGPGPVFILSLVANVIFIAWIAAGAVREQASYRRGADDAVRRLNEQARTVRERVRLHDAAALKPGGDASTWAVSPDRVRMLADASALERSAAFLEDRHGGTIDSGGD